MSAYIVATVSVKDPDTYSNYTAVTPGLIEKHGGRFIVRGGDTKTLEGDDFSDRMVIIEFPDKQALENWYNDPDYQDAIKIRQSASTGRVICVEGV